QHYDPNHPITLKCDASDYAIAAILSQTNPTTNELHPITFYTHTMITAKLNYNIYNKELLMIHEAFKQWRVYLEGTWYEIQVFSDHNNLQYFTTTKQLSHRQACWAEYLSSFNYVIHYQAGKLGVKPDALMRRPNVYLKKSDQPATNMLNNKVA